MFEEFFILIEYGYAGSADTQDDEDAAVQTVIAAVHAGIVVGMSCEYFIGEEDGDDQHHNAERAGSALEGFDEKKKDQPEEEQQEVHHEDDGRNVDELGWEKAAIGTIENIVGQANEGIDDADEKARHHSAVKYVKLIFVHFCLDFRCNLRSVMRSQ